MKYLFSTLAFLMITAGSIYAQNIERCRTMQTDSIMRYTHGLPSLDNELEQWIQDNLPQYIANNQTELSQSVVYTIPVIVHVVHNGDAVGSGENISQAQVNSQIDVLNEDFRRIMGTNGYNTHPDGADTEIEFCLAQIDENGNTLAEPGINRVNMGQTSWNSTNDIDNNLKPATIWDPDQYLNMWTVRFGGGASGLLGYAQFPSSTLPGMGTNPGPANSDGVVMRYDAFGRVGNVTAPYDLGRTTTHEVGHWLGLRHVWGDGGCGVDDYCADTPESDAANYGCQTSHSSCGSQDMVENYMDYSDDGCMNIFTNDQTTRMRFVMDNSPRRVLLKSSLKCAIPSSFAFNGQVVNAQNNQGIANAHVLMDGGTADFDLTTDANGNFTINNMFEDSYDIIAGQWGFVTSEISSQYIDSTTGVLTIALQPGYYDDFLFDYGWTVSGDATTGEWVKDDPIGTTYTVTNDANMEDDVQTDFGDECFMTGNGGGTAGTDDVDNGVTLLTSPVFDLSGYADAHLKFFRWFFNDGGSITPDDSLVVTLSNGTTTEDVMIVVEGDPYESQWHFESFRVSDYITPTANMTFTARAMDYSGSGHLVEAGIDLFQVIDSAATGLPPSANFGSGSSSICAGSSVSFNDLSTASPTSWQWTFPGGSPSTSTAQSPSISYNTPGSYDVTLVVTNGFGSDSVHISNYVTVSNVVADFNANDVTGCEGLEVAFQDVSQCGPTSYQWIFPGGTPGTSTAAAPVVTYNSVGSFDVTLIVSNGSGSDTIVKPGYVNVITGVTQTILTEDFETTAPGWTVTNPDNDITWVFIGVQGATSGSQAVYVNNYNYNTGVGERDGLISPVFNLTDYSNAELFFEHAHVRYDNTYQDSLIIYVSTDGGNTFPNRVFARGEDGSGTLATNAQNTNNFVPAAADDWCHGGAIGASCFTIDLSAYDGYSNLALMFENYCDYGNNMFIDNVEISAECGASAGLPPTAAISASDLSGCVSHTVNFSDNSTGAASRTWSFPGGSPASSTAANPTVTYSSVGSYTATLTVTNAFGTDMTSVTVDVFANPTTAATGTDVSCNGGNDGIAVATANGGQPGYTFNWSHGPVGATVNNLSANTYTVTVTDNNGCTASTSVVIGQPAAIQPNPVIEDADCFGENSGSATLSPTGGQSPYTYSWSNNGTGASQNNLGANSYGVTITDANGCTTTTSVTVGQPADLSATGTATLASPGNSDGTATVNPSGGTPGYTYQWNDQNSQTTQTATNLPMGLYTCVITDDNGCKFTIQVQVDESVGIGTLERSVFISIAPNPSSGLFMIDIQDENHDSYKVEVMDVLGREIVTSFVMSGQARQSIDLTEKADGLYLVNIIRGTQKRSIRILKQ